MAKISVIIVTFQRLSYLTETIDSVLNQTYKDIEVLIISDGHEKNVEILINTYDDHRIKYLYIQHCGYPAKARNFGISNTSAPFISFCDDDDIWEPDKLEKQINIFNKFSDIDLCFTNRRLINSKGEIFRQSNLKWIPKKTNLRSLLISNYITYSSVILKRDILEISGIFPDDIKYKAVEDYHLWIRIALINKIYFIEESLVLYRVHSNNITQNLIVGAKKNLILFKDLFKTHKFKLLDKTIAYLVAYTKILVYKIL